MLRARRNGDCEPAGGAGSYARTRERSVKIILVRVLAASIVVVFIGAGANAAPARPALIPMPGSVEWLDGSIPIAAGAAVDGKGKAAATARYVVKLLGLRPASTDAPTIRLAIVSARRIPSPEGYHLRAAGRQVLIEASDPRGLFYGAQTMRQLVTPGPGPRSIAAVDITDAPRFRWRGLLIDVSRHFFGKPTLFKIMDEMAAYKLNVLHLHLTDDSGWRFEVPAYPKLTQSAVKPDGTREYFTAKDIREIVAYAAGRHIMVVPEIELPSHSGSAAATYPGLYNGGSALDPARPGTYAFIGAVMGEVARLFPAPYIHFGGDEVADDAWSKSNDVDELKAKLGLKTTREVEAYFVRKVVKIIEALGKKPMAWDEQAEAGASQDVAIEWWRKDHPDVLSAAAERGSELVMSPVDRLYFDYHQAPGEPGAPWEGNDGGPTSIAKILAWEPVPASFTPAESAQVLGVEAAVWTEFIETQRYLEFMTFPRLLALSEVAWRAKGPRDDSEFEQRLKPHIEALRARGINARRGEWDGYEFITH
jgi:hexosaminidase